MVRLTAPDVVPRSIPGSPYRADPPVATRDNAMLRRTYTATSSSTATDSTTLENRVPRRFRSAMIREITGMLVTAIASAKTSAKATRSLALPMNGSRRPS